MISKQRGSFEVVSFFRGFLVLLGLMSCLLGFLLSALRFRTKSRRRARTFDSMVVDTEFVKAQDRKFKKRALTEMVCELLPNENPDVEVVFFQGLHRKGSDHRQAFWRTWTMKNSEECWPEVLLPRVLTDKADGALYKPRVLSVRYENRADLSADGLGTVRSDEYLIVENLYQDLIVSGVGQKQDVPVLLVGHDLGGILVKTLLLMVRNRLSLSSDEKEKRRLGMFLNSVKSIFFYDTPHIGAHVFDEMAAELYGRDSNQMLRLMGVLHKETARINQEFADLRHQCGFSTVAVHAPWATRKGREFVTEASARQGIDRFISGQGDHYSVCRASENATDVQMLGKEMVEQIVKAKGIKHR